MARKANQALVGAFVLGALLLAVAGVVILGGGHFLRRTETVVAYFDGSLKGLDIGSPVTFNGVKIGSVVDIGVVIDPRDGSIRTPVVFSVDLRHLHLAGGGKVKTRGDLPKSELMIAHGLRAQLALQSFVTGQLAVELNFYPNTPVRLTGLAKNYAEVPTIPSQFEHLTRTLENLPIEALVAEATETLRSIRTVASAPEVKSALVKLDRVLGDADGLVRHVDSRIDPLLANVDQAVVEARAAMTQAQEALARLTPAATATLADYQALAQDTRGFVAHADAQLEILATSLRQVLADAHGVLGDDSPVRYDLANTLQEMTKTAKSLRTLADYLERHPEALLSGKRRDADR
jgi:paraquat-inducible protein B